MEDQEYPPAAKRLDGEQESSTRRRKKKKYEVLEEDWGMTENEHSDFLYSGLEGVKRMKEQELETTTIRLKKSSVCKALEKAAMHNYKISDWIVKNSEELKIKENIGDTCTPPQVDGVNKSQEPETSVVGDYEVVNGMEYVNKEPLSTSEGLVQAEYDDKYEDDQDVGLEVDKDMYVECLNKNTSNTKPSPIENMKKKRNKKTWTKLRNGLFGWRVVRTGLRKTIDRKQAEAELGTAKTGAHDNYMLESPDKVLPGGMEKNAGNSVKRKRQQYFEDNFGWDNKTGVGVAMERTGD